MGSVADYIAAKKKKNPEMRLGSLTEISQKQEYPPMTTGNIVADYVTSIGGIPRGVVTEIRGFMSSGKSSLAAQTAAAHQKRVREGKDTGAILYLDYEYAVDAKYFAALGLDIHDEETFVYYQPDTLEDGFQLFLDMTKEGLLALGVVDSIASASVAAEFEGEIGKQFMGNKAKAINQVLRMCVGPMRVHGAGLILINHTQVKIPQTFGEKQMAARGIQETISPGGKGVEYYTSLRLETSKPKQNKEDTHDELSNEKTRQVTSTDVEIVAFKNKLGIPHRSGKMRVRFGKGFSQTYSAFHILVDHKVIKKKTAGRFEFPEDLVPEGLEKTPVGEDNVVAAIEANPEWATLITKRASELVLQKQQDQKDVDMTDITEADEDGSY